MNQDKEDVMALKKSELIKRAQRYRKHMTRCEAIIWERVRRRGLGVKIRRQHVLMPYIVDFYCPAHRVVIEIDGPVHDEQRIKDVTRDTRLREIYGVKILRFSNEQVLGDLGIVLEAIAEACPPVPRARRGGDYPRLR